MQLSAPFISYISRSKSKLGFWGTVLILTVFHVWSLMRYPGPFVDEAWFAARAWTFLEDGRVFSPLDGGVIDTIEGYWTFLPFLPTLFGSWGMWWFDAPSLWGIRIVSLIFGLLLVGEVYAIGTRLGGSKLGLLGAFLTGTSHPFIYSGHLGRPDIYAAALGFGSIALHLKNYPRSAWISALAGLVAGIAFEIHPNGVIFFPVVPFLYFLEYKLNLLKRKDFWSYILGVLVGLFIYLIIHIFPYPEGYFTFMRVAFAPTHLPPLLSLDLGSLLKGLWETAVLIIKMHLIEMLLIPWAVLVLLKDGSKTNLKILGVLGVVFIMHGLLIRNKQAYYAILITPTIALTIAKLAGNVFRESNASNRLHLIRKAILLGVIIISVVFNMGLVRENSINNYKVVGEKIAGVISPTQSIMGPQTYWFEFYEHQYYSWENLIYYQRANPYTNFVDALNEFQPDILIIDAHWDIFITDRVDGDQYLMNLQIPKKALNGFLNNNADQLISIDGGYYGRVRVYKLAWDSN